MQRSSAVGSTLKSRYLGKADFIKFWCEQEYVFKTRTAADIQTSLTWKKERNGAYKWKINLSQNGNVYTFGHLTTQFSFTKTKPQVIHSYTQPHNY